MKDFKTIRETAKMGILNENALRKLCHEKKLPGLWIGTRFYINIEMLREQLNNAPITERRVNIGE